MTKVIFGKDTDAILCWSRKKCYNTNKSAICYFLKWYRQKWKKSQNDKCHVTGLNSYVIEAHKWGVTWKVKLILIKFIPNVQNVFLIIGQLNNTKVMRWVTVEK